jgi:prevent-host-death family protein
MKAVSVRELKNNPSDALRMAQTDVVVVTSRNRPEAVLVHLDDDKILAEPGVRTALAVSLFKNDALPLGRAARLAGMALADFIQHVSRLGIPVVKGDERSLREDLDDLDAWLAASA